MSTTIFIPRRAIILSLIVVIALAGVAYAYARLQHATITVFPATHTSSVAQEITLSSGIQEPDFVRYILPAKVVEKEITETSTITREGTQQFDDFATGRVRLFNKQPEEQRLLPKTHLKHEASGVFFLTDTAVTIPPENDVEITATAKEKGPTGNVPAGRFIVDKLPASLQSEVYGESLAPFSGGVSVDSPVTEAEIKAAQEKLKQETLDRANAELSTAAGGAGLRPDLVTLETIEESTSVQPGSKTTEFTVVNKVRARAFIVDDKDLLSLTLLALRSSPAADEEFVSYDPDSFKIEILRSDFTRGEARIKGTLAGSFASKTGPTLFSPDNLAGRSESEVQEYFKQFPSVGRVEVAFSPFWVKAVPSRQEAIEIVIKSKE
ncbi:MAG: hypothetical protein WD972_00860 [Candidatus Andersenbacteria bacterium]